MPISAAARLARANKAKTPTARKSAKPNASLERDERASAQYLAAAQRFAESARAFENRHDAGYTHEERIRYRADVTGAVISAAAYLESWIDELYVDLWRMSQPGHSPLRRELTVLLHIWSEATDSAVLERYQSALAVSDGDRYVKGRQPFASADAVLRLRELLVEQTQIATAPADVAGLQEKLQKLFPPSKIAPPDAPWFPEKCLGAGCAEWAVKSVEGFAEDFCRRMHLPARPAGRRDGAA